MTRVRFVQKQLDLRNKSWVWSCFFSATTPPKYLKNHLAPTPKL